MTEAVVVAALLLIGAGLTVPFRRTTSLSTRLAVSLPFGVGVYLMVGWTTVTLGLRFDPLLTLVVAALIALTAAVGSRDQLDRMVRRDLVGLSVLVVVAVIGSLFLQAVPLTRITPDSPRFIAMAGVLAAEGTPELVRAYDVTHRHILEGVFFALAALTPRDHLLSLMPLFGLAGMASAVALAAEWWTENRVPPGVQAALAAGAVALLASSNRAVFNLFYIHGHMIFAVYLVLATGGAWFAARRRSLPWAAVTAAAIVLVVAVRVEGFLVALLVVVPFLAASTVPSRARWLVAGAYAGASLTWFGLVVLPALPQNGPNHAHAAMAVAGLTLAYAAGTHLERLRPVYRWAPHATVAATLACVAAFAVLEPEMFRASADAVWENAKGHGAWRLTWLGLPLLIGGMLLVVRLPHGAILGTPLIGFLPLTFTLALLRGHEFRVAVGDSWNRMLMHILLVAVLYLLVSAAGGQRGRRRLPAEGGPARRVTAGTSPTSTEADAGDVRG